MELRAGYKQTEVGVIPEDWDVQNLGTFGKFRGGNGFPLRYQGHVFGDYPFFKVSDMNNDGNALFMQNSNHWITEKIRKELGATAYPSGSIIFAKIGAAIFLERKKILSRDSCIDNNVMAFVFSSPAADWRFLHYIFLTIELGKLVSATALPSLNGRDIAALTFRFPKAPEQRAIAATLSDADALIAALDALIAKKRDLKQAAMQQLLTGKKRLPGFTGEWEVKRLGEIGKFLKGSGVRRDEAQSGNLPCVRYGEIYTVHQNVIRKFSSHISHSVAEAATRIQFRDLLFAGSGETKEEIGKCVALADDVEAYAGGDIVILRASAGNPVFLGYLMNTPGVVRQKANRGQGDAVVHISAAALASIEIVLPDEPEQEAVAAVLADMDTELATLEAQRDKARALKQGMMQELLAGRIRLV
jgi:type I restriction enzyme, S subunit